jgi:chemotaxis protein histidine kinase CheA
MGPSVAEPLLQLAPEHLRLVTESFLEESRELLAGFAADLDALERSPADEPRRDRLFRAPHSIASGAAQLGLLEIAGLADRLERATRLLRNSCALVDQGILTAFRSASTSLGARLDDLAAGRPPVRDVDGELAELDRAVAPGGPSRGAP